MKRIIVLIASGFGLGLSPVASGTVGSLPGILIAAAIAGLGWPVQAGICFLLTLIAVPISDIAEKEYGKKDDGRIVVDEYLTFPICLIGLPWLQDLWILPVAFVVARLMDIIKPFPARLFQDRLKGGLGVVADDFVASLYALGVNHALVYFVSTYLLK